MTNWDNIAAGSLVPMGLLQIDIAGSSRLSGTADQIANAKALFRGHVERIVEQYGGRLLAWPGDGGSFMFRIVRSDDYTNMVLAAVMLLNSMENINDEIALKTGMQQPLAVRISCDSGVLRYDPDPGNIQGDFVNKFLKNERAISQVNRVTISDRARQELPQPLKDRFVFFKNSPEIESKLYALAQRVPQEDEPQQDEPHGNAVIAELKRALERDDAPVKGAEVIRLVRDVPRLEQVGIIKVAAETRRAVEKGMTKPFQNDAHAILKREPEPAWHDNPLTLRYEQVDYVGLKGLSEGGTVPVEALSASVVAICAERRELYLHRRSPQSRTYPSYLHTIGGAYKPPAPNKSGDRDLVATAQREFWEETGMHFLRSRDTRLMIARETQTGFIQLVLLGVDVSAEEVEVKENSWEGDVVVVEFDKLAGRLLSDEEKWVPTGWTHVVAWLGLGAPPLGPKEKFGGLSAKELYAKALASTGA